jgi:hypothetical protein
MTTHGAADTQGKETKNSRFGYFVQHVNNLFMRRRWASIDKSKITVPLMSAEKTSQSANFFKFYTGKRTPPCVVCAHYPYSQFKELFFSFCDIEKSFRLPACSKKQSPQSFHNEKSKERIDET